MPSAYRTNTHDDSIEDLQDISSLAADGLIRLREHPEDDCKESARFAQESLHSYRFSPSTSTTTRTDIAELRKSLMNRSIDFMKHRLKSPDTLPAHYHPSTLFSDDLYDNGRHKTKSVGYSPVAVFNVEQYRASRRRQRSNPMPAVQEDKPSRPASPVTPDDVDLVTAKLKHLDSHSSSSSSSSSSYSSCTSSSDDLHDKRPAFSRQLSSATAAFPQPALHNSSRFLPQNQAILTTYDDWRVILSNDVAALVLVGVGGSCRGLVGKSVVDFIEPSYQSRFLDMVIKRREELSHLEDSTGGMVLVCGNVVRAQHPHLRSHNLIALLYILLSCPL